MVSRPDRPHKDRVRRRPPRAEGTIRDLTQHLVTPSKEILQGRSSQYLLAQCGGAASAGDELIEASHHPIVAFPGIL